MAGEWRASTWGEEISLEYGKALRSHDVAEGRYRVFGSNGPIGWAPDALAPGPGVILGRKGAYRGVQYSPEPFFVIDTAYYVVPKSALDMRWLYYAIKHYKLGEVDDGSPIPSTTRAAVYVLDLDVPPSDEQRAIAHILGALDDKIELNQRMNETLEATARALFKSWFVDFDPVRAKAEGWKFEEMGNHVESSRGFSYDGASIAKGGVPFHNLNSIFEGGGYKFEGIKSLSCEFDDRRAVEPDDVIVANTEQGHERLLLGSAALIPRRFGPRTPFSHHLYRVRVRRGSPLRPVFVLHLLNDPWMHDLVSRYGNGTTVNMLPTDALELPRIAVPPASIVARFEAVVLPLHHRVEAAVVECESLAALRDALLPKLISGDLRVKDAERFIGRAT
ncbi:MAG: restriction endonuclease subunit S [Planctomycetes bacterium]|nr:restriction endonuclease subunit S [Planctomycetota bacterium]